MSARRAVIFDTDGVEMLRTRPAEPFDDVSPALSRLRKQTVRCPAVVEDAPAGMEAGRRGRFGLVVGVSRTRAPDAEVRLRAHGTDVLFPGLTAVVGRACGEVP
ncbi:hypothetical protein [Streptomyces flavotricini]|uniref:hypothetical protein n=1 Tax=Streptomyces flavotricini TaxID=66888 RepID=UPI0027E24043|nr:hypothetical protein [Streptomyces flavotricini]